MRSNLPLLVLFCIIALNAPAQKEESPSLNIGDPAPALWVHEWLKGTPTPQFEKGRVYVVEFWATWCGPCIESMPHLTALATQYKDQVTVIGIDILEKKTTPMQKIRAFVTGMGSKMNYCVGLQEGDSMQTNWLYASGEQAIPCAFIVDRQARLAWIGTPFDLDEPLKQVVNQTIDLGKASARRKEMKRLESLDQAAMETLYNYAAIAEKQDSIPFVINELVQKEPNLKYAPVIASYTFLSLLKTDPHKAYEYGKQVLVTSTYTDPAYGSIIGAMDWYGDKLSLPTEIYTLAAEACQAEIDRYPLSKKSFKFYHKMAGWYFCSGNKEKAIEAEQKAIDDIKTGVWGRQADVSTYEAILQQYKN